MVIPPSSSLSETLRKVPFVGERACTYIGAHHKALKRWDLRFQFQLQCPQLVGAAAPTRSVQCTSK